MLHIVVHLARVNRAKLLIKHLNNKKMGYIKHQGIAVTSSIDELIKEAHTQAKSIFNGKSKFSAQNQHRNFKR